jgi:hypothetical protein
MTTIDLPRGPSHLQRKAVEVRLRGGKSLEGMVHIPEGLPLLHFLGTKKYFLNLTSVRHSQGDEILAPVDHLSLRLSNVVWIVPLDGSLHVSTAHVPVESTRTVELQLVDGLSLTVDLNIAEEQRMTDYLDANWSFVPLWSARLASPSRFLERMAVNHEAILAIREVSKADEPPPA